MGKLKAYRDLDIWRKSIEFVREIYTMTVKFPKEEILGDNTINNLGSFYILL
jgi:hypothetical protein